MDIINVMLSNLVLVSLDVADHPVSIDHRGFRAFVQLKLRHVILHLEHHHAVLGRLDCPNNTPDGNALTESRQLGLRCNISQPQLLCGQVISQRVVDVAFTAILPG